MQGAAAAFKEKRQGNTGDSRGACDPDYENISLTFRERAQPKGGHPGPLTPAPAQPRPPLYSAQVPTWLQRSIMSLFVLLGLMFLFCIILSALVLVKNFEMSREMQGLKRELSNISSSVLECQEEQRKGWSKVWEDIEEVTKHIGKVRNQVEAGNQNLKTVPAEVTQIRTNIQKILEALERKTNIPPPSK
ncbi:mast cell-expressed membrane protein 1 isoform X2 [Heterocephalus glaber]|uniref:Mast cell-expressed membrane protein 1 isoform X2 n=1 Tax=Heterocephalus glaber TaxID=10181 RepID=A0AAX6QI57_HETGA|nr:mast cell-expressed membrane protein 1 isoform X2 [Heterocephalus glaber]